MNEPREAPSSKSGIHFGYLVVVALVITSFIPLSLALSCAGIFYPALSDAFGVDKGVLSYYTSVLWISALVTLPFMGRLLNAKDARACLSVATGIIALAFVWLAFMQAIWQFFVAAIAMGIGVGMLLFLAPSTLINRWFAKRAGFMLGICMAFTGVGGMVWSTVGGMLIEEIGWSGTYLAFALLSALTLPFTVFMIASRPESKGLLPYGHEAMTKSTTSADASSSGVPATKAFKMPVFYLILATCFCLNIAMPVYFMIPSYASTLEIGIIAPLLGATASSVAMGGQTIAKLVLGAVGEKHPQASTLVALGCGVIGSAIFILITVSIPVFYASAAMFGIYYGITNVMMPLFTRAAFGNEDYAVIYARVSMIASISNAVGAFLWGTIISIAHSYAAMFAGAMILMVMTGILVCLIGRSSKTSRD